MLNHRAILRYGLPYRAASHMEVGPVGPKSFVIYKPSTDSRMQKSFNLWTRILVSYFFIEKKSPLIPEL